MIRCTVCGEENDDLSVVCVRCRSFLQSKVDTLDLFHTIWSLMYAPGSAFRRIVLSRNKNYSLLLSSLLGIALVYSVAWFKNLGRTLPNLFGVLAAGFVAGPLAGLLFVFLFSLIMVWLGKVLGGKAVRRNMFAVVAYASFPIVLTLVFVFPIEVAIFGAYLFDNNPPPLVINPAAYVTLLGLDALGVLWSWLLVVEGAIVAHGFTRGRALLLTAMLLALTGAAIFFLSIV
jgi:hypothetical protein